MVGLIIFYRALSARGAMTVVAPVTAVTSATIPVDLRAGQRRTALDHSTDRHRVRIGGDRAGQPFAGPGRDSQTWSPAGLVVMSVASGACFALFFIFMAGAAGRAGGGTAGLWPSAAAQLGLR